MEVVQSCSEVYPRLYSIMHSAPFPDLERTNKLQNIWGIRKRGEGGTQVK